MVGLDFHKLLASVAELTVAQLVTLDATVRGRLARPEPDRTDAVSECAPADASRPSGTTPTPADPGVASVADIEARFALAPVCPHCQGSKVIKWNTSSRLQRYQCKPCDRTFNALTGTPFAQLHKRELWLPRAGAGRRHLAQKSRRAPRGRFDHGFPLAASISRGAERR